MIGAVVLASGSASRFGAQKLLLPLSGAPLLRRTVESVLAAHVQPVVVVPGQPTHAARVRRILGDRVTVVSCDGA